MEAVPIVANGTMYVSSARDDVYALDAATGRSKWEFRYTPQHILWYPISRGVAYFDGRVYVATVDGHLIALQAASGKKIFDVLGVHDQTTSFYSMAPLPYRGMILLGAANGDWGGVGYVTAFSAADGKRIWEWRTIPRPGEPGNETWSGDSWKRGGASVWGGIGAIEETTGTLYLSVGNPSPQLNGTLRKGANLYSCSIVALDILGPKPKIKWFRQLVPHDTHDWDAAMPPVLIWDQRRAGRRRLVAVGDKAGNFWVFDAKNGALVSHARVSTQRGQDTTPSLKGNLACPGSSGGIEFNGGAFNPQAGTFIVASVDQCGIWNSTHAPNVPGQYYLGGDGPFPVGPSSGWYQAIDVDSGRLLWSDRLALPGIGGTLTTASGLAFFGTLDGEFSAYDVADGHVLWSYRLGASVQSSPISIVIGNRQYVVVTSGPPGMRAFPDSRDLPGAASVTAFALR